MPVFVGAGTSSFMKSNGGVGVSTATTSTRNALSNVRPGTIIFNQTTNLLEYYNGSAWTSIDTPPNITSVNNTNILETQIASGFDLVISGAFFSTGATVQFIGNDGTTHNSPSVAVNSPNQITARVHSSVSNSNEPYDVKVTNASGLHFTKADAFNVNAKPAWTTSAGTLATISDQSSGTHATLAATDPEGDTVTYTETASVLSNAGLNINSSTGVITGDPNDVSSSTTLSFTARATSSGSNTTDRNFNIIVDPYREVYFAILGAAGGGAGRKTNSYVGSTNDRGSGGGGCFIEGVYEIKVGTTIYWYVGQGGGAGTNNAGGTSTHGGNGGTSSNGTAGAGGNYSGIFTANSMTQTNALMVAGGGGGGGSRPHAGNDGRGTNYGGGQCESTSTGEGNDGGRGHNAPNHSHGGDRGGQGGQQNGGGSYGTSSGESGNSPTQANGSALVGGQGGTAGSWGGGGGGGAGFFGGGGGADDGNSWGGQGGGAGSSFIRGKITNYSTSAFNSVSASGIVYKSGTFRTASFSSADNGAISGSMRRTFDFTSAGFGSGWGESNSITPGMGGRENSSYPGSGTAGGNGLVFYRIGSSGSYTKLTSVNSLTGLTITA